MKSQVLNNLFELNRDEENDKNELIDMLEVIKNSKYYSIFKQVLSDVDEELFIDDPVHGISHNERVAILATYLAIQEDISIEDYRILLIASLYHDIGRTIAKGREHGRQSANLIKDNKADIIPDFDDESTRVVQFLCTIHSNPDDSYQEVLKEYGLEDSNSIKMLTNIIKDADALDRVRLRRFGQLDLTQIRNESSRQSVSLAKMLFREYKDIEYELGGSANLSIFDMNSDELLEDEDNYYLIRGLNRTNIEDIDNPEMEVLRTKARVLYETTESARFYGNNAPTLEEVFSNVRTARYGKETQCTSFTSNAAVATNYNADDNNRFVMIPIPKASRSDAPTYNAGRYLLQEINKKVASTLRYGKVDNDIKDIISQIESETTLAGISSLMEDAIDKLTIRREQKRYTNSGEKLNTRTTISSRINQKKVLTTEQELEYIKTVAKLTVLELTGYLPRVIPSQKNNTNLLITLGSAFSSNEYFYYGDIPKDDLLQPSKEEIELLSLLQQSVARKTLSKEDGKILERKLLSQIRVRNHIIKPISRYEAEKRLISTAEAVRLLHSQESDMIIPYYKGSLAIEYAINYSRAKIRTQKLLESLKKSFELDPNYEEYTKIIDSMMNDEIVVADPSIIRRRNGSGITLFGAVNLDMNIKANYAIIFSTEEHESFIKELNSLTSEELEEVANGNLDVLEKKRTFTRTLKTDNQLSGINDYYIDYIIDNLIYNHRFEENTIRTERDLDLRKRLKSELSKYDIEKLFNAFLAAGVTQDQIPNLIINLLLENGYADKESFEELISSNNLIEFINENLINFNRHLSMYSLERFLQITDSSYHVENTNLTLREYQALAKDNLDEIYKEHNFAGVVLPTGAGKSFVTMAEMLEYKNKEIVYFAPQEAILRQIQQHILKNILNKSLIGIKDVDAMISMSSAERKDFLKDKVFNRGIDIEKTILSLKNATTEEEKEEIRRIFLPRRTNTVDDVMDAINTAEGFPHLKMYCYQSLNSSQFEELQKKKIDFMVLDEVHRIGAQTWGKQLDRIISFHPDSKILGITATPVRDTPIKDENASNSADVMRYMAKKYGNYTFDELEGKEYLASEMYLLDAIRNHYVVEPKIVPFKYTLALSSEYEYVKNAYSQAYAEDSYSRLTRSLQTSLEEMNRIIGETPFTRDRVIKKEYIKKIASVIEQNFPEHFKNGRMIVFLEQNPDTATKTTEDYILEQIDLIEQYFTGINPNIKSNYLLSNRKNKKENEIAISEFESIDSDELKLLFAINMLNEGVHVENVNGELMLRRIGDSSNILYFQQIGRVIYSIDPEHPPRDEDRPIIFDFYNNYLTRDFDKLANRTTETSDLQVLMIAKRWIEKNGGEYPDIDSSNYTEVRKAISLKKIQKKYDRYKDVETREDVLKINSNLSRTEVIEVLKIVEISRNIDLFDRVLPDRTLPSPEEETGNIKMLDVTGEVQDFLNAFKTAKRDVSKSKVVTIVPSDKIRLKNIVDILQTLSEYGFDITDQNFINQYMETRQIGYSLPRYQLEEQTQRNLSLYDILENAFDEETKNEIIYSLDMDNDELEQYKIYGEFCNARSMLTHDSRKVRNLFNAYDITLIRKLGLFTNDGIPISIVRKGFIFDGPSDYENKNIYTGTDYDEEGYDYYGYDAEGYNREGYNQDGYDRLEFRKGETLNKYNFFRSGINFDTADRYNLDGFDIYKIHKDTMDYFDRHGFDIDHNHKETRGKLSPNYLDYEGRYYELLEEGSEKRVFKGRYYDENGRDVDGWDALGFDQDGVCHFDIPVNERGFNQKGYNIRTLSLLDEHGLNAEGQFCYLENEKWIESGLFYGTDGYNSEGVNERGFNKEGINVNTNTFVDEYGFDVNEIYWKKDENGEYKSTNSKYDENKTNCYGINKYGFGVDGLIYEKKSRINGTIYYEKTQATVNEYGFDADLKYDGQDYNPDGFNADKIHKETGDVVNIRHFNIDREYCIKDEEGNWVSTGKTLNDYNFDFDGNYLGRKDKKYDPDGYDWNGLDIHGFNRNHMYVDKDGNESVVNEFGFGYDGYIYEQDENGVYVKTDRTRDEYGFDFDGLDELLFDRDHIYRGNKKYDPFGFDSSHINKYTGTELNPYGFDCFGIHYLTKESVNERHFNIAGEFCKKDQNGKWKSTRQKLDDRGFDIDENYFGEKGIKYDPRGFNCYGINRAGFNEDHMYIDENGNESVVNEFGFGYDGYIYEKDENGVYVKTNKTFDRDGFDFNGFDKYGFDRNNLYQGVSEHDEHGFDYKHIHKYTSQEYNSQGFSIDGINRDTGDIVDERHFNIDCEYCIKDKKGNWVSTGKKLDDYGFDYRGFYNGERRRPRDPDGYDCYGFNQYHFNRNHMYVDKDGNESVVNEYGFGYDGFIYEKDENGVYVKTDDTRDEYGYNINNLTVDLFDRDHIYRGESGIIYDRYGFDSSRINRYTKTELNPYGFNCFGIHSKTKELVNERHFNMLGDFCIKNARGKWKSTGKKLDDRGFDLDGNYLGEKGIKYNPMGYDCNGLDKNGFDENHMYVDKNGNKSVTNEYGFGYDGYIYEQDENGNYIRTDKTRDKGGYDINGYDKYHFDRNYLYLGESRFDTHGFDHRHINKDTKNEYDGHGFNINGIHKDTGMNYNQKFFDIDGYFYEKKSDGKYYNTNKKYNRKGFNIDGTYKDTGLLINPDGYDFDVGFHPEAIRSQKAKQDYEEQMAVEKFKEKFKDGICITTNLPYDEYYFREDRRNAITGGGTDFRGFDCLGQCRANNNLPYDKEGFKIDGRHKDTGEFYYDGYNCYGVDKEGRDKSGKEPFEIQAIKKYLNAKSELEMGKIIGGYKSYARRNRIPLSNDNIPRKLFFKAGEMYPAFKDELKIKIEELMIRRRQLVKEHKTLSKNDIRRKKILEEYKVIKAKIEAVSIDNQGER